MKFSIKTILSYIVFLVAVLIPIRFEYLELLRFTPLNYYYLKFYFPYFVSILLMFLVFRRSYKTSKKLNSKTNFIYLLILIAGISSIWILRKQTTIIQYEMIVEKDGLSYNSLNGKLLDGTCKSPSSWDGFGDGSNCTKQKFKKGINIGTWMNSYKGDMIHSGEYLHEQELQSRVVEIGKCSRVDINNWKEGNYSYLYLYLLNPENTDSVSVKNIISVTIEALRNKYEFSSIKIIGKKDNSTFDLMEMNLEN